ncbi:MAG: TetR/AcrR family transcriptional regulator [Solirubrobacterales bacterium]
MAPGARRRRGRPPAEQSPASLEEIYAAALRAFATHGYEGVSVRMLTRELGVSHSLISARCGSKDDLWYATVDWAFEAPARRMAIAFDPTLTDPLDQLRTTIRTFLTYSAAHPELLCLMNIEALQDTDRLAYIYETYIEPALAPIGRLLDYLVEQGRTRPISLRAFHFLMAHGGAAPFTLAPLARRFDDADPLGPESVAQHAELVADLIVRGLEVR